MLSTQIRKIGDPILRKKTDKVSSFNKDELSATVALMKEAMVEAKGIGLAANQIGLSISMCIIDITQGTEQPRVFINPEIVSSSEEVLFDEGCLSIPGVSEKTKRFNKLEVRYQDLEGNVLQELLEGTLAVAMQHEIDHLNGKLYIDSLSMLKKQLLEKRYRKVNGLR